MYTPASGRLSKEADRYNPRVRPLPASLISALERHGEGLKILVVRLGALGDILRTLPAVRLVHSGLPGASIHWLAREPWTEFLEDHRDLDGVVAFPADALGRYGASPLAWPRLAAETRKGVQRVRRVGADLVLDFHGDLKSGLLGILSGAPTRLGYSGPQQREGNRLFTTHHVPAGPRRMSRIERNLLLVRALGLPHAPLPDAGLASTIPVVRAARALAASLAGDGHRYAVLAPGASRRQSYKKPPAPLLAAAARALARHEIAPIVVHGPGEEADAARAVGEAGGLARLAPPTDLRVLAELLRRAHVFVGGDSGPLHLACAVGCPVVALYGPTDPIINAPWGVPSAVVCPPGRAYTGVKRRDRRQGRFEGIAPEHVEAAVEEVLTLRRETEPRTSTAD